MMAQRATQSSSRSAEDGRSSAYWLILGLVAEYPSHGYEISRRYESRFGELVPLTVPRVYAALDRLRDDGLIEQLAIDEADDVPKQHLMRRSYRASRRGKKAYRGWLVDQLRDDPLRIQLLERIISVEVLGVEATLEVVDRYAEVCLEELRALPAATDLTSVGDSGLDQITSSLLEDQQRRELGARYDWAVYARQVLEEHAKESSAAS